ncbi:MAG: VCBS repeat-containing protein, partial [Acidobacteriota bacterium]|nr:VCBS repeat-containing protein [Acidobacteriota bacterium]
MKYFFYAAGLFLILSAFAVAASAQTTFTNGNSITIADLSAANPYPSTIAVSGLSGTIPTTPGSIKVRLNNFSHTFPSDVGMVLVGPTGAAFLIQDSAGDDPDVINVTYTLSDDGTALLPFADAWGAGTYKPTAYFSDSFPAPGPGVTYNAPQSEGTATFASTFGGTNPNGDWKLYIGDFSSGDSGSISGGWSLIISTSGASTPTPTPTATPTATPTVTPTPTPIPSTPTPTPSMANVDFNGDHKTDFVVTRLTSSPLTEVQRAEFFNTPHFAKSYRERLQRQRLNPEVSSLPLYWYYSAIGAALDFGIQFGTTGDFEVPADYDGDGKTDIAVWRPGAPNQAAFYILQSSTGTVRKELFGQDGDDPTIVGDYDGDKKADVATFRCPQNSAGQCYFFYRGSLNNPNRNTTYIPFGSGVIGDYFADPGDYDGDGKYDFCLQRKLASGQAQFVILKSLNFQVDYINWGLFDDMVVPGDFDGDGKSDFMVVRPVGGQLHWFLLTRTGGGTGANAVVWGLSATDYPTPGDYDGD